MTGSHKVIRLADAQKASERGRSGSVDPEEFVRALRDGRPWAERVFLERERGHVERILTRILGWHAELDDLCQDVFTRAFERIDELREPEALRGWLSAITVFVAREAIRRKRRRRWLLFLPPEETPDLATESSAPEARAALRAFYDVVATIEVDARIAFTLRCVGGLELNEIAEACDVSLATVKRRIRRAADDFYLRGRAHPELVDWFEEGTRWRQTKS